MADLAQGIDPARELWMLNYAWTNPPYASRRKKNKAGHADLAMARLRRRLTI
jgi:hypothetical protein